MSVLLYIHSNGNILTGYFHEAVKHKWARPQAIVSVIPAVQNRSAKILFEDNITAHFNYVWV